MSDRTKLTKIAFNRVGGKWKETQNRQAKQSGSKLGVEFVYLKNVALHRLF